jgi:hypothetical protein
MKVHRSTEFVPSMDVVHILPVDLIELLDQGKLQCSSLLAVAFATPSGFDLKVRELRHGFVGIVVSEFREPSEVVGDERVLGSGFLGCGLRIDVESGSREKTTNSYLGCASD